MKNNLLINLPEDIFITHILLSKVLPIKSLLNLRCVCKYLNNLITNPAFIKMQISAQLNNNSPLVLVKVYHSDVFFSLKFNGVDSCRPEVVEEFVSPIEHPNIWGSCNGLLCLTKSDDHDTVCFWNPFMKEFKVLPPPLPFTLEIPNENIFAPGIKVRSITYGFGYDCLLNDYKIIRCSEHLVRRYNDYEGDHVPIIEFQVYTLGTNTWRKIDNNPYRFYVVSSSLKKDKSIVFVNGALHWVMATTDWRKVNTSEETEALKIVSFDIEKEVLQEIQTPLMAKFKPDSCFSPVFQTLLMTKFRSDLCFCPMIQVLKGCLCVLELDSNTEAFCNVWMMMDYGVKESWTKLFTIVQKEVSIYKRMLSSYKLLRFCENGTGILMQSNNVILVYDTIKNKALRVTFGENFGNRIYQSEVYIESIVSLTAGVYKGERKNAIQDEESEQAW